VHVRLAERVALRLAGRPQAAPAAQLLRQAVAAVQLLRQAVVAAQLVGLAGAGGAPLAAHGHSALASRHCPHNNRKPRQGIKLWTWVQTRSSVSDTSRIRDFMPGTGLKLSLSVQRLDLEVQSGSLIVQNQSRIRYICTYRIGICLCSTIDRQDSKDSGSRIRIRIKKFKYF
jgi:hypothetical protein